MNTRGKRADPSTPGDDCTTTQKTPGMSAVCSYDFAVCQTVEGKEPITREKVTAWLEEYGKSWALQLEKCPTSERLHYQGRISLKVAERMSTLLPKWKAAGFDGKLTITSSTVSKLPNKMWYAIKSDSRVEGPWTSVDEKPMYEPRQIREITTLYPWQEFVMKKAAEWEPRIVNMVYDPRGCNGKSILCGKLVCSGIGWDIPPLQSFNDVMRAVMDMPKRKCYVIDVPRSLDQAKIGDFYAGIERLKDGKVFDDRNHFRMDFFDSPNVWAFTTRLPNMGLLTRDRWVFWRISDTKTLNIMSQTEVNDVQLKNNKRQKISDESDDE